MSTSPTSNHRGHSRFSAIFVVLGFTLLSPAQIVAAPNPTQQAFFEKRIRPVLAENCFRCHGDNAEKPKGGLRVDSIDALLRGGDSGPALVPGQPAVSRLVEAVSGSNPDLQMPPRKRLSDAQIADLTEWVRDGAPWPASIATAASAPSGKPDPDSPRARTHWAFTPPKPVTPPATAEGVTHPIDAFIRSRLLQAGLQPPATASPRSLARRLAFGLTGLPPSPEDVENFASDPSDDAWERLIDRLLASPHHGEKWGRHWLDLVRFAETNSYETDEAKPHAWRYRDYVIRSLNADKPYDQFIREQIAGDEIPGAGPDGIIATGYYRLGIWDADPADRELALYDQLDDLVATTGQVFLGLTVDCARCHDHKIDPISQRDYYALLSFFRNIQPYHNGGAGDEVPIPDGKALAVTENKGKPPATHVLFRGNPASPGAVVEPAFPRVLGSKSPAAVSPTPTHSSGRRTALAQWLASPDNPLTARVIVNRVWQHHFGRGLVRSPSDFGFQGTPPTHPELLDWLTIDFIQHGWSLKHLHRRILTSQTWRASSAVSSAVLDVDPPNDLFSRFEMRRLAAEEIRDAALWISGMGNPRMAGPGVFVPLPKEVLASQSVPGKGWGNSPPEEHGRRSIYIHVKRSLLHPVLLGFDMAETDRSTPVRFTTTQPMQALSMLNGPFFNQCADQLANRIRSELPGPLPSSDPALAPWVQRILHLVTQRPPSTAEIDRGIAFIRTVQSRDSMTPDDALRAFCLLALNLNETIHLD